MATEETTFLAGVAAGLEQVGVPGPLRGARPLGGGCIHDAARVTAANGRPLFLKSGPADRAPIFAAEAAGLRLLADAASGPRIPEVLASGTDAGRAWLVLEFVPLDARVGDAAAFGRALARMHARTGETFGLDHDNFIGTTPQPNDPGSDWCAFWRACRLGYQLDLAAADGHDRLVDRGRRLLPRIEALFAGYRPVPSLLHGDLWSGNHGWDDHGRGTIFDPAVYRGDREADIAMTELFGGFPAGFHAAYNEAWPLDRGYPVRRDLYNLYHVLNHAHLFGGGYIHRAGRMIEGLLAAVGE